MQFFDKGQVCDCVTIPYKHRYEVRRCCRDAPANKIFPSSFKNTRLLGANHRTYVTMIRKLCCKKSRHCDHWFTWPCNAAPNQLMRCSVRWRTHKTAAILQIAHAVKHNGYGRREWLRAYNIFSSWQSCCKLGYERLQVTMHGGAYVLQHCQDPYATSLVVHFFLWFNYSNLSFDIASYFFFHIPSCLFSDFRQTLWVARLWNGAL